MIIVHICMLRRIYCLDLTFTSASKDYVVETTLNVVHPFMSLKAVSSIMILNAFLYACTINTCEFGVGI